MNGWKVLAVTLAMLCVFQTGWIVGSLDHGSAQAARGDAGEVEEVTSGDEAAGLEMSSALICRHFMVRTPSEGATFDTSDRTTEIGQWVGDLEDQGRQLYAVDFEMGLKGTGYPQEWVEVCMY